MFLLSHELKQYDTRRIQGYEETLGQHRSCLMWFFSKIENRKQTFLHLIRTLEYIKTLISLN